MKRMLTLFLLSAAISPVAHAQAVKQIVIGYEADATSLDPAQVTDINSMQVLTQMYEPLVMIGKTGGIQPGLASKWTLSADRLTYTFTLRPGLKFSSGDPLDADAVAFTFMRQLDKANPGNKFGPFPFAEFYYGSLKTVKKVNATTVQFVMNKPDAAFLAALTVPTSFIVNPKVALKLGKTFALQGSGSGPYGYESWSRGGQLILKKNTYFKGATPGADRLVWLPIVQTGQRATSLQSGTVDLVINPAPENLASLKTAGFNVATGAGPHIWWIGMNLNKAPFNNKLVRQAMSYAIDRPGMIKGILYDTGVMATQPLASMQSGYNTDLKPYTYDTAKAKALLTQAGFPNGFTATMLVPTSGSGMQSPVAMGTAIQAYLSQIGIKINIQQLDWGTYLSKIGAGADKSGLEMWQMSWMNVAVDPAFVLDPLLSSSSFPPGFNTGFYKSAAADSLMTRARAEADPKKRGGLYQQAEAVIVDDAPWLFVDHAKQVVAYNKNLKGFALDPIAPFLLKLGTVSK
ncbi:ABC transporter substrate-binding protein (plasmid) [Deinococcus psychrotolerans]|uniref:ABC transporter substrate-binding protein n=1 Tax=Deinococcus psychrotolerans TaxID=2489213 RepID=A0A3G8YIY8_9DEIO|nr:ABC transporter substrate-binding protein [Deinococcus psychrotolerans]AZI44933.1 ABC transporter substrate-binding protein [Deinococcus psychrotolerans]